VNDHQAVAELASSGLSLAANVYEILSIFLLGGQKCKRWGWWNGSLGTGRLLDSTCESSDLRR